MINHINVTCVKDLLMNHTVEKPYIKEVFNKSTNIYLRIHVIRVSHGIVL